MTYSLPLIAYHLELTAWCYHPPFSVRLPPSYFYLPLCSLLCVLSVLCVNSQYAVFGGKNTCRAVLSVIHTSIQTDHWLT